MKLILSEKKYEQVSIKGEQSNVVLIVFLLPLLACEWSQEVRLPTEMNIKLLESPIPAPTASSQKAHFDNISGTKRGTIDPLVSKRPEKILNKKIQNSKNVENGH